MKTLPVIRSPRAHAWFFDLDGTLVEIAERPDAVSIAARTRDALAILHETCDGAVAIVTGREIAFVDSLLAPLELPIAGVHGLTRRARAGSEIATPDSAHAIEEVARPLAILVAAEPGLLLERKSGAVAIHFRSRPDLEARCIEAVEALADRLPNIQVKRGKMVVEARVAGPHKGDAVRDFMSELPFRARVPVYVGDDRTDEDAFREVNAMDGISVKIGPEPSAARYRVTETSRFLEWLHHIAARIAEGATS